MKLYYTPGACSQAPHIALLEIGSPFEIAKVDLATKKLETGDDYLLVNPKGAVPAIELDDGAILTENAVVLQYIADRALDARLIPPFGTLARYRLLEWLNYIATELHKGFAPLFHPAGSEADKAAARDALTAKFDYVAAEISDGPYLTGADFTIADAYLFVVLRWTRIFHIDLGRWPPLAAFVGRVGERPAVQAALHAEGFAR